MWLVSVTRSQVWRGAGVLSLSLSHTGHWKFNMAPNGKELSEDLKKRSVALHKDGVDCQDPETELQNLDFGPNLDIFT